jgi:hypothetical protein
LALWYNFALFDQPFKRKDRFSDLSTSKLYTGPFPDHGVHFSTQRVPLEHTHQPCGNRAIFEFFPRSPIVKLAPCFYHFWYVHDFIASLFIDRLISVAYLYASNCSCSTSLHLSLLRTMPAKPRSNRGRKPASSSKQTRRKGPAEPTAIQEINEDIDAALEASEETHPSGDGGTIPEIHISVR